MEQEFEFKSVKLLMDVMMDKVGRCNEMIAAAYGMGVPMNHPVAYELRAELRLALTTLRQVQNLYAERHNNEVCGCEQTPEKFEKNGREIMEVCDKFIKDVDDAEVGLTPMDPTDAVVVGVKLAVDRFCGEDSVFGEDGPAFPVDDLGGYL